MATNDLSKVRNIGIAAHVDAGKTTLTERILFYTGALRKIGEVHDGQAHTDYIPEEQEHGITIMAAVTRAEWLDHQVQIIDTPGHVDFTIEVERSMRVLDGCVVVLDGVRGVEPQTETVWRQRNKYKVPACFFINKMDRPGADYRRCLETIGKKLGGEPIPVIVPLPEKGQVVNLVTRIASSFHGEQGEEVREERVDDETWESLSDLRETLLLAAAEFNEELEELVLMDEEVPEEMLWAALRVACLSGNVFPCFGGSALKNLGVQPLLDALVKIMPAPGEGPLSKAVDMNGSEVELLMDKEGPLAALVFKVQHFDGRKRMFCRIYRGTLKPGDIVTIPQADGSMQTERVARVFDIDADKAKRIDAAIAGQIVALAGLKKAATGDTLCSGEEPVLLERIEARDPVLGLAIEPESAKDEAKLVEILAKLTAEDPTLRLEEDEETGQRVLRGMGELHLQMYFERIQREANIRVRAGKPDVVMRETIGGSGTADALFHRVIEAEKTIEMKAWAKASVSARERGSGVVVDTEGVEVRGTGTVLSPALAEAIKAGATDASIAGPILGAELQDVAVKVLAVELFAEFSTPQAMRVAVAEAVRNAMQKAGGQVLRPIMKTEVVVPAENLGAILGDLQARQATIHETEPGEPSTIRCDCPLDKLLGYTTTLRSMTRGRGNFSMVFDRFDVA